ncbi:MAG: cupin domain-containing protein [Oscillospiraceae bacterium]|nr:cupin domain-containing protein [Oscillospiraceae bacterium]
MIKRRATMRPETKENLRGGHGALSFTHIFEKDELCGKANMFAEVTLLPGESIGEHPHGAEGEIYIVKSGTATVTDCGEVYELSVGDAMWTTAGETHSVENKSEESLVIYAIILP